MTIESIVRQCLPESLVGARNMLHKAVQPMTRAARANLPAAPDASHTNMRWDDRRGAFTTNPLRVDGGEILVGLAMTSLTLLVMRDDRSVAALDLSGVPVGEADAWLDAQLSELGLKTVSGVVHPYELSPDAAEITAYATDGMEKELVALAAWFAHSDSVLKAFAGRHTDIEPGPSPVRCWPHHFDIATYVSLEAGDFETARGIGVGLSPGDESYGEPYFYVNPWPHPDPADLPDPPGLGHWHTQGFVGAILTGSELLAAADIEGAAAEFIAEAFTIGRGKLGF